MNKCGENAGDWLVLNFISANHTGQILGGGGGSSETSVEVNLKKASTATIRVGAQFMLCMQRTIFKN